MPESGARLRIAFLLLLLGAGGLGLAVTVAWTLALLPANALPVRPERSPRGWHGQRHHRILAGPGFSGHRLHPTAPDDLARPRLPAPAWLADTPADRQVAGAAYGWPRPALWTRMVEVRSVRAGRDREASGTGAPIAPLLLGGAQRQAGFPYSPSRPFPALLPLRAQPGALAVDALVGSLAVGATWLVLLVPSTIRRWRRRRARRCVRCAFSLIGTPEADRCAECGWPTGTRRPFVTRGRVAIAAGLAAILLVAPAGLAAVGILRCRRPDPIFAAAAESNLAIIEARLAEVSADLVDREGFTALHHAASTGALDAVRLLLQRGASIHGSGRTARTPLAEACEAGAHEIAAELLDHGANISWTWQMGGARVIEITPLEAAVNAGSLPLVRLLIDRGADLRHEPLMLAVRGGHLAILDTMLESIREPDDREELLERLLAESIREERFEVADWLLARGATLRSDLYVDAMSARRPDSVRWLHARGVPLPPAGGDEDMVLEMELFHRFELLDLATLRALLESGLEERAFDLDELARIAVPWYAVDARDVRALDALGIDLITPLEDLPLPRARIAEVGRADALAEIDALARRRQ